MSKKRADWWVGRLRVAKLAEKDVRLSHPNRYILMNLVVWLPPIADSKICYGITITVVDDEQQTFKQTKTNGRWWDEYEAMMVANVVILALCNLWQI